MGWPTAFCIPKRGKILRWSHFEGHPRRWWRWWWEGRQDDCARDPGSVTLNIKTAGAVIADRVYSYGWTWNRWQRHSPRLPLMAWSPRSTNPIRRLRNGFHTSRIPERDSTSTRHGNKVRWHPHHSLRWVKFELTVSTIYELVWYLRWPYSFNQGYMAALNKKSASEIAALQAVNPPTFSGVEQSEEMLRWIWENFSAVAGDQPSFECWRMSSFHFPFYLLLWVNHPADRSNLQLAKPRGPSTKSF